MATNPSDNSLESFLSFNDPETPEKMREVAKKELGETEEVKTKCLQEIKELIREKNLATITRDDFLLRFLRTKKFRIQRCFEGLQNYSRNRAYVHERFMKLRSETVERCIPLAITGFLPYRDAEERITVYFDLGGWNPSICSDEEAAMIIILLINYFTEKVSSQITGLNILFECKVVPLTYVPYLMRHIVFLLKFAFSGLPVRYRAIHFINQPAVIKHVIRLLDPLLPKKIKERLVFHGKKKDLLFQYYAPCILPDCFGGTLGPLSNDHITDELVDYLQKMKDEQIYFLPPS